MLVQVAPVAPSRQIGGGSIDLNAILCSSPDEREKSGLTHKWFGPTEVLPLQGRMEH